jgi:hypothetical protein
MNDIINGYTLPKTTDCGIEFVKSVETEARQQDQVHIVTEHLFHGGVYTRTICVPAGVMITGALIKIPTTLTVSGHALIVVGDNEEVIIEGFMAVPASSGRKQVFIAYADTFISMSFKTDAKTVDEAEREFTDEFDMLKSRDCDNYVVVTGE